MSQPKWVSMNPDALRCSGDERRCVASGASGVRAGWEREAYLAEDKSSRRQAGRKE